MKNIYIILALVVLCGISFASVNPKLQLQGYTVSKIPGQPGDLLNVTLQIKSLEWDNCASRVSVQLSTGYPLSIQGSDTQYVESLCYQDPDSKGQFSFLIPIDPLAQSGTYQISVVTTYEKRYSIFSESNTLNIVVGGAPSFVSSVTGSNPVDIYPGDAAAVSVTFQNNGSTMVKSAHVTMSASPGIEVKWAGATQEIGQINPYGSATETFEIQPDKNLTPGSYQLSAKLDYIGENNSNGTSVFYFNIPIKPKSEFTANVNGTSMIASQSQDVNITIKNTGYQEARKLKIQIKPVFPFSTDGTVRYIDSLMPGQEQNVTYTISTDKDGTVGQQLLSVLINYEDPQGKKLSDSADFSLTVRRLTLTEQVIGLWYLWVIIALVIVMRVVRKPKK